MSFLVKKDVEVLSLGRKSFDELPEHVKENISGSVYINLDMQESRARQKNCIPWMGGRFELCIFNLAWFGGSKPVRFGY